jgi:uncharacterized SAM-binding protein YcdF (DUF218 family)
MEFAATRKLDYGAGTLLATAAFCTVLLLGPNLCTTTRAFLTLELENRFVPITAPPSETVAGIIALGGSHGRVVEAIHLARQYPNAKLVVTGESPQEEAYVQAQGFGEGRLVLERHAKTTYQNALFSYQLLAPDQRQKWLIVTSAIHMPRAVGAFREVGFSVLPWPVFDQPANGTEATRRTLHEVFGLLYYWLLGRIDSLFPAPNA